MERNGCINAIDVAMNGTVKTRNLTPVQIENVAVNIGTNPVSDLKILNRCLFYHDLYFDPFSISDLTHDTSLFFVRHTVH